MGVLVGCVDEGGLGGGSVGGDTGGSVGGGASVTAAPARTVRVAVIPGTGVGMVIRVGVELGAGWAAVLVTCTTAVLEDDAD